MNKWSVINDWCLERTGNTNSFWYWENDTSVRVRACVCVCVEYLLWK